MITIGYGRGEGGGSNRKFFDYVICDCEWPQTETFWVLGNMLPSAFGKKKQGILFLGRIFHASLEPP